MLLLPSLGHWNIEIGIAVAAKVKAGIVLADINAFGTATGGSLGIIFVQIYFAVHGSSHMPMVNAGSMFQTIG